MLFAEERHPGIEAAIRRAMAASGVELPCSYLELVSANPAELDNLLSQMTVCETYFNRDPDQFSLLRHDVLPELSRRRPPGHVLRVWCAGCATGEEAYSVAMLLDEEGLASRAQVLGTDLSRAALTRARQGLYGSWSFRGCSELFAARHFERAGRNFRVRDRIRQMVRFEPLNLARDAYPSVASGTSATDILFFRNVAIYLDSVTGKRVYEGLFASLAEGGVLLPGASDPMPAGLPLRRWPAARALCYQAGPADTLASSTASALPPCSSGARPGHARAACGRSLGPSPVRHPTRRSL